MEPGYDAVSSSPPPSSQKKSRTNELPDWLKSLNQDLQKLAEEIQQIKTELKNVTRMEEKAFYSCDVLKSRAEHDFKCDSKIEQAEKQISECLQEITKQAKDNDTLWQMDSENRRNERDEKIEEKRKEFIKELIAWEEKKNWRSANKRIKKNLNKKQCLSFMRKLVY